MRRKMRVIIRAPPGDHVFIKLTRFAFNIQLLANWSPYRGMF